MHSRDLQTNSVLNMHDYILYRVHTKRPPPPKLDRNNINMTDNQFLYSGLLLSITSQFPIKKILMLMLWMWKWYGCYQFTPNFLM